MVKLSAKLLGGAGLWERNTMLLKSLSASKDGSIPDAREPAVRAGYPSRIGTALLKDAEPDADDGWTPQASSERRTLDSRAPGRSADVPRQTAFARFIAVTCASGIHGRLSEQQLRSGQRQRWGAHCFFRQLQQAEQRWPRPQCGEGFSEGRSCSTATMMGEMMLVVLLEVSTSRAACVCRCQWSLVDLTEEARGGTYSRGHLPST
ncbi:hypothetical protein TgHK011_008448 [Trichoderma gracile]|nr:hypothetical protein TgHK011_008448 [Trichoderma gracile]